MKKNISFFVVAFLFVFSGVAFAFTDISIYNSFAGKIDVTGVGHTLRNSDGSIADSSTASLTLPAGVTVKAAFLYWAGSWNSQDGSSSIDEEVTLVHSSGSSLTITSADRVFSDDFGRLDNPAVDDSDEDYFGCFRDVTAFINNNQSGDYTLSDLTVWTGTPHSTFSTVLAGWTIFIVFEYDEPSSEPLRVVNIYDGFKLYYSNTGADSIELTPSNFVLPATGYDGKLGHLSWEGDNGNSNAFENLYLNGDTVTTSVNVLNNHWIFHISLASSAQIMRIPHIPSKI